MYKKSTWRRCRSPKTMIWSRHSRRSEPISRSAWPFWQGERGAIGRSRMPMARSCHILGDRGLTYIDAELEEFAMDPGRAPERIGEAYIPDQLADFEGHFWPAYSRARLPSPEQAKPGPMPADDRLRLDDHQGVQNAGYKTDKGTQKRSDHIC